MKLVIDSNNEQTIDIQLQGFDAKELAAALTSVLEKVAEEVGEDKLAIKRVFLLLLAEAMLAKEDC